MHSRRIVHDYAIKGIDVGPDSGAVNTGRFLIGHAILSYTSRRVDNLMEVSSERNIIQEVSVYVY